MNQATRVHPPVLRPLAVALMLAACCQQALAQRNAFLGAVFAHRSLQSVGMAGMMWHFRR